ncbi:MAG TPA: hypothetical protein VG713_18840 [Pirellulales bacterium]|nr:hypothetical protein [Pirellulales bacterium]
MRQPVIRDGDNARVAGQDFIDASRRRIASIGREDVGFQQGTNRGQLFGELGDNCRRTKSLFAPLGFDGGIKLQLANDLFDQLVERLVERMADEIVDAFGL